MLHQNNMYTAWVHVTPEEKQEFKHSTALLLVSVGQVVHEGKKLQAALEKINGAFSQCTIAVCDTLQRHTLLQRENLSPTLAFQKAEQMGDAWIERSMPIIRSSLTIPYVMRRWEADRATEAFETEYRALLAHYHTSPAYQAAMSETIEEFIARQKGVQNVSEAERREHCFRYLLEECVIIMKLWQSKGYHFIVYPSHQLKIVQATWDAFVFPKAPHLLRWARIKVKSRKGYMNLDKVQT